MFNKRSFLKFFTSLYILCNPVIFVTPASRTKSKTPVYEMPLKGTKVLELVGLAPAPLCGKILADFGANVTRIDKLPENSFDVLQYGKRTLAINLKLPAGQKLLRKLANKSDVLIEPYRPGVMEKLNLGPDKLCKENKRLIYARLTGFGQAGHLAARAGHDLNYVAISGVLSMLGRKHEKPTAPVNLLADFAGGSLMCAFGICIALLERHCSGCGQVVDAAMLDGTAYVASWLFMSRKLPIWDKERGRNLLDGGAYYYDTYETKDGRYMSVAAIEPQFFELLKAQLQLPEDLTQNNEVDQARGKALLEQAFLRKTQAEWTAIFENSDACVQPVIEWHEVLKHKHNVTRDAFEKIDDILMPKPAPRLSRTPGQLCKRNNTDVAAALAELELTEAEQRSLEQQGVLMLPAKL